jgi:ribosomal protein L40E
MADLVVCSQCGARNPAEIEWCGQCFASLADAAGNEPDVPTIDYPNETLNEDQPGVLLTEIPPPADAEQQTQASTEPTPSSWVCPVCETPNPLEAQECSACGTSIYTAFGATDDEKVQVDPQQALFRSVMFPGLGHAYAKQGLLGSAIGGLTLMALGFGIALVAIGVGTFGWPLVLLALGIWVAAAFDAFRIASGQSGGLLLRPRIITALVGSVMIEVILAALLRGRT